MEMRPVAPNEVDYAGPLRAMAVFRAGADQLVPLEMKEYQDELGLRRAAFLVHKGVALSVQRHDGNPPDTYSVLVDVVAAHNQDVDVSDLATNLLHSLDLQEDSVLWRAADAALH